jgi:enoyl-CoA hydratase
VKPVSYEVRGTTAILTIERPERRNAVDNPTAVELLAGLRRFEDDDEALILILTGAGDEAFCAGSDLKAMAEGGPSAPTEAIDAVVSRPEGPMGFSRLTPSKPTIAAISGWCLAGGFELALWCDLRIASRGARFGCPERRWGVPLIDGGTVRLPRIVGQGRALDLILTGRIIDAEEALDWGLLTEVVDEGAHLDRALEIAAGLARFPQQTMLTDRRSVIEGSGLPLAEALQVEADLGLESVATGIEGATRFAAGEGRGGTGTGV